MRSIAILLLGISCFIGNQAFSQTTIWSEDFETYPDGSTIATNNNTANPAVDWTAEPIAGTGTWFLAENAFIINGIRSFIGRNTGQDITKTWQSEVIDISGFRNVSASMLYAEAGGHEANDSILMEYRLDGGAWVQFSNGFFNGDMTTIPDTAKAENLIGCSMEIRVTCQNDATNEYWYFDDIIVSGFATTDTVCFTSTSMSVSETSAAASSNYTYTQTVPSDGVLNLDVSPGNLIRIVLPNGDFTSANLVGSTFNGSAIASFTKQTSDTIEFNAPIGASEGASFDIVINGVTNPSNERVYNSAVFAANDEGGLNHSNYSYTVGPSSIWFEDFESYADNAGTAVNNNAVNPGVDWVLEPIAGTGTSLRVENNFVLDGTRSLVGRNTGAGISKEWTSEVIDISAFDNARLDAEYFEFGTCEANDSIAIEYRLDGGPWVLFDNGFQSDDMNGLERAIVRGLKGCEVEIRVRFTNNATNEYWSVDNIRVSSEDAPSNACFTSTSLNLSSSNISTSSTYTFNQTTPVDGVLDLDITTGSLVRVVLPSGDLSTATLVGSSFNGSAIASFTKQTSDTLEFNAPVDATEGVAFDIVLAGVTNASVEDEYYALVEAVNDESGLNYFNFSYDIGPSLIWFEDFESYADNAGVAVDNNTNDIGIDWFLEGIGGTGTSFRVENNFVLDGTRSLVARNTGAGISRDWTSEVIDISPYNNVRVDVDYGEYGDIEANDSIVIEYRLDGAAWVRLQNGFQADDMAAPERAVATGLLGCELEIRITMANNATNEYWTADNIRVSSESAPSNACFTSASMSVSETGTSASSQYTYTQTIPIDGVLDLDITTGNLVRIVLRDGDFSSATTLGSTFDGVAIAAFTTQTADTLEFLAPSSVTEGSAFDIVIANATNPSLEAEYNSSVEAVNDEGGLNHFNYSYIVGPSSIWFEDFESYADNASVAVDNNSNDVGLDWVLEGIGGTGTSFRVENNLVLDGNRSLVARNTGTGISRDWTTEIIDISAFDNVRLDVLYSEFGDIEDSDSIVIEYKLDDGAWVRFNNGFQSNDMAGPEKAIVTGLLGCEVQIRITVANNATNEYWSIDNIRVSSEGAPTNACFTNASMSVSQTNISASSDYTYTQTIPVDGVLDLGITSGNLVRIVLPDGDFSSATTAGSTFDGVAIAAFTTQTADTLEFLAPSTVTEGSAFDIVIAGATNPSQEAEYNSSVEAVNDEGGINHFNYSYTVGPISIWFEDFETYADNATIAVDNNSNDVGADWTLEGIGGTGTSFRVENNLILDGTRSLVARNTGTGISRDWTTEIIDISAFDNVRLDVLYSEFGDIEDSDSIAIEYKLDDGAWVRFNNGFQANDMAGPEKAIVTGLLGCEVQIRVTVANNATNEYWSIDNVRVSSEGAPTNACFTNTSMSVSQTNISASSDYTYTQTIPIDGVLDLDITSGNLVRIVLPDGDFSSATTAGSTFDGVAIAAFTTQTADTLEFLAPSTVTEGSAFDILIAGVTNPSLEGQYNSSIEAINDEGGINHFNYSYTAGPLSIWFEDFETYADNATVAVDNNTNDVGIDWTLEPLVGTSYRVENSLVLDGSRSLVARNIPTEQAWTTESINIEDFNNVKAEVLYSEFGDLEDADSIRIQYRLDGSSWVNFNVNGRQFNDMAGPVKAVSSGILGCSIELRVLAKNTATNEYWSVDNVRVSSESVPNNSCFDLTDLTSDNNTPSIPGTFTYTQTIENDVTKVLDITTGNQIQIVFPDGDFSTATLGGSTFNGIAIGSFITQTADTLIFNAPTSVGEGVSFDIVIANVTNPSQEGFSSSQVVANNDGGGVNHYTYRYAVSPAFVFARLDGDWNQGSTWSTIDVGGATCDCEPGNSSVVLIDGYDINSPTSNVAISSLRIQNDIRNDDASLEIGGGITFSLSDDLYLDADDNGESTILSITGAGTQFDIGDSLSMISTTGNILRLDIDNDAQLNVGSNFIMDHSGLGDLLINVENDASINVTNDVLMTIDGGDDLLFIFGNTTASNGQLSVGGNLTMDHNGAIAGDDMQLILNDNANVSIAGSLNVETDYSNTDITRLQVNDNAILDVEGNIEFTAISAGESEIELNNDSELRIGGNFAQNGGFGFVDANNNATITYDGTSGTQIMTAFPGPGTDEIEYINLRIDNSFGTAPQLSTSGNIEIPGTIVLNDGVISTTNDTIISTNTAAASISGFSSASFIDGNLRRSITTAVDTIPFPVGTGSSSADYHLAELLNNNLTGISALNVNVSTITEAGNNVDGNLDPTKAIDGPLIVNIFEDAEWDINPFGTLSGGSYGLRLHVENIAGLSAALDNAFTILKRPSTSTTYFDWDVLAMTTFLPPIDSAGRIYDAGNGFAERTGYTSFSKFAIGASSGAALPVDLISFKAIAKDDGVRISWRTTNERNASHFIIERADDNLKWEEIARVEAKGGSIYNQYASLDNNPLIGTNYYRLRQVDIDGSFEYSRAVSVYFTANNKLTYSLYPNPTNDILNLEFNENPKSKFQIFDLNGLNLMEGNLQKDNQIYLDNLPAGTYILRIENDSSVQQQRFVKIR